MPSSKRWKKPEVQHDYYEKNKKTIRLRKRRKYLEKKRKVKK